MSEGNTLTQDAPAPPLPPQQREREREPKTAREVVKAAAEGRKVTEEEVADALDWFFQPSEDPDGDGPEPKALKLNMGTEDNPRYVRWVIVPVDEQQIQKARETSRKKGNRRQRRDNEGDVDEILVARKLVAMGTVEPDLGELAAKLKLVDPADALLAFFRKSGKTGLITQISGEILNISGYDDSDLQEMDAALG